MYLFNVRYMCPKWYSACPCMYPLQKPCGGICHQPRCPKNALLQFAASNKHSGVTSSGKLDVYGHRIQSLLEFLKKVFLFTHPIANNTETTFSASKLMVRTLIESTGFSLTLASLSEWWYRYVQDEISISISIWQSSFQMVRKIVAYWSGATSPACLAMSAQVADGRSVSWVVGATKQGLKHANTHCVDSCFWEIKLLDCHTQNFMRFLVAVLGQFVNIACVGVLAKNTAKKISQATSNQSFGTTMSPTLCLCGRPVSMGDIFHFRI